MSEHSISGSGRDQKAEDFDLDAWAKEIHFPGFSAELAAALLTDYNIAGYHKILILRNAHCLKMLWLDSVNCISSHLTR